jgi:hypothetical protein
LWRQKNSIVEVQEAIAKKINRGLVGAKKVVAGFKNKV